MNLSPRNKLLALAVALLLVVVVLVTVLVVPQFGKLSSLGAKIVQANSDEQTAQSLLDQRRTIKDQAAVTNNSLLQLASAVPENPELPSLIIELQDAAYASGVSLRSVAPVAPVQEEGDKFVTVGLSLEVWGTWADTVDFLQRLRKLGRAVRVKTIDAGVLEESAAEQARIELPPYYQIKTNVAIMTYVIPAGSVVVSSTPDAVPAPAPAQ